MNAAQRPSRRSQAILLWLVLIAWFVPFPHAKGQLLDPTAAPRTAWSAVAASADFRILFAAKGGVNSEFTLMGPIYHSQDAGKTWKPTGSPTKLWAAIAVSWDGERVIAAHGTEDHDPSSGLYLSEDHGVTWKAVQLPNSRWTSVASSADGSILFAVEFSTDETQRSTIGLYVSRDYGQSWTPKLLPGGDWLVACSADGKTVFVAPKFTWDDLGPLLVSEDSGETWHEVTKPINDQSTASGGFAAISISADGSTFLAAAAYDAGVYLSGNRGRDWKYIELPNLGYVGEGMSVAVSADGSTLLVTGGWGGGGISRDGGFTWTEVVGLEGLAAMSADGERFLQAAGGLHIYPYTGAWRSIGPATGTWTVLMSTDGERLVTGSRWGREVSVSSNRGQDWSTVSGPAWQIEAMAASSNCSRILLAESAQSGGRIYVSTNGSKTWVTGSMPTNFASIACSSDGGICYSAQSRGLIYRSVDGGASWAATSGNGEWGGIACSADGKHVAAISSSIVVNVSTNAGLSWIESRLPNHVPVALRWGGTGRQLFVSAESIEYNYQLFHSENEGQSWSEVNTDGIAMTSPVFACADDGRTLIIAGLESGSAADIYVSRDGGISWMQTHAPAMSFVSSLVCSDHAENIVAADDEAIFTFHEPFILPVPPAPPRLSLRRAAAKTVLSWVVPSSRSILQECSDVGVGDWRETIASPVLNPSNLLFEVELSPIENQRFLRLVNP